MATEGYLAMVLHGHLPYVRHPEYEDFLEERWLYEAITESYLPFLQMAERLEKQGVYFRLAFSLSPPLVAMLLDPLLQERYKRHIETLIELSKKEIKRTEKSDFQPLALMYRDHFEDCLATWEKYGGNLIRGFAELEEKGYVELFTTAATHAFLPAYRNFPEAVRAQIHLGRQQHEDVFGEKPQGLWLPECGFYPGLEDILGREKVGYFFVEQHGMEYATPMPHNGIYAPIYTPEGTAVFGRDPLTSEQVWSSQTGYPGDPYYREYYRDIGYDLDYEYIKPYIHIDGIRLNTGIKYYRITGRTDKKQLYDRKTALAIAGLHAEDFLRRNLLRCREVSPEMDIPPLAVSPYDAELFGHWWFEGPNWLEEVFRRLHYDYPQIRPVTPSEYLERHPQHQVARPATSSWGKKGYSEVWINEGNSWIYRHLLFATEKMIELATKYTDPTPEERRRLNQAARELLLAQSSDWPFLMDTGTAPAYARKRVESHISRFLKIVRDLRHGEEDFSWLEAIEFLDNIFPSLNYRSFAQDFRISKV